MANAAKNNDEGKVEAILSSIESPATKADVINGIGDGIRSPLGWARSNDHSKIIMRLVENGGDLDQLKKEEGKVVFTY